MLAARDRYFARAVGRSTAVIESHIEIEHVSEPTEPSSVARNMGRKQPVLGVEESGCGVAGGVPWREDTRAVAALEDRRAGCKLRWSEAQRCTLGRIRNHADDRLTVLGCLFWLLHLRCLL